MSRTSTGCPPVPTPYRVSTITAVGSVSVCVDLPSFYAGLPLLDPQDGTSTGYTYVEMAEPTSRELLWRGVQSPAAIAAAARRAAKQRQHAFAEMLQEAGHVVPPSPAFTGRHFNNQVTVVFRLALQTPDGGEHGHALMNLKVFRNGMVQLTGVKLASQGMNAVRHLVEVLRTMPGATDDPDTLAEAGYRVCLINSDFRLGFELRRERLFAVLRDHYGMSCTYEPCIYPGVNVKYMWNADRDGALRAARDKRGEGGAPQTSTAQEGDGGRRGVCCCPGRRRCTGKGDGSREGMCRKITIAVFQSGCVIITGAHTLQQVDDAYDFVVKNVVADHFDAIRRPPVPLPS
jgi:TATA-box binding protein (TBP) (component of TFIID and TFIIIB)